MKTRNLLVLWTLMLLSWGPLWAQGPTVTSVMNLDGGCMINVTAPANNFGGINTYQYSLDNGATWTTPSPYATESPVVITGLTNCNTYSVKIRASQWYGNSAASSAVIVQPKPTVFDTSNAFTLQAAAQSYSWNSVTFGNGLFVAVASSGQGNRVMTSPDGVTWTSQTTPADQPYKTIAYGNGTFVALANGNSGAAMTSTDGITWTQQTVGYCEWESVTFGGGMFVAVASSGYPKIMYSSDGISWNAATEPAYEPWKSVTYGAGKFVAVAEYGSTYSSMTSTDGINWTGNSAIQNDWKSVSYGAGKFVAVCANGTNRVMSSTDGTNWTSSANTVADNGYWTSITYGNGLFVAVAQYYNNKIMWSLDGVSWSVKNEPASDNWQSVTFGNGRFVAVANYGTYQGQVMTDSMSFSAPPDAPVITVAAGGATVYFTPPASSGTSSISYYEYSTDNGTTWINPTSPITASPFTIAGLTTGSVQMRAVSSVGNSCPSAVSQLAGPPGVPAIDSTDGINGGALVYFTAPASDGGAAITNYEYSTDNGTTWVTPSPAVTSSPLAFTGALQNCTSGSVKIRALNIAGVGVASASSSFTTMTSQFTSGTFVQRSAINASYQSVVYGNGVFVAVGGNGAVMTSPNGIAWTKRTAANTNDWRSVAFGNGLFVAVAQSGSAGQRVMTSPDGITWTARTVSVTRSWYSIAYGNGVFVAVADGAGLGNTAQAAIVSANGINWTLAMDGNNLTWNKIVYGQGKFLVFSNNGSIVKTSTDGFTWSGATFSSAGQFYVSDGIYAGGKFVIIGSGPSVNGVYSHILYSTDGVNWNYSTGPVTNWSMVSIVYGNGVFLMTTVASTASSQYPIFKSTDGINWTQASTVTNSAYQGYSSNSGDYWFSMTYANSRFVAVNNNSSAPYPVMTSNVITKATPPPVITSITPYHTSCFVNFTTTSSPITEQPSNYQYSINNGTTWTSMNPAVTTSPFKISGLTNGTTYNFMIRSVSLGGNSCPSNTVSVTPVIGVPASAPVIDSILNRDNSALIFFTPPTSDGGSPITNYDYSVDSGTTWITRSPASTTSPLTLAGISNCSRYPVFIRVLNASGPSANSNLGVANPRNTLVDVPTTWTSTNGPTITGTANGFNYWYDIAYGNGLYVVVGDQGGIADKVLTSPDGVNWTKRTAAANIYWNRIAFGNGVFVATSYDANSGIKIMSSADGISWTSRQSPFTYVDNIVFANGKFVAVGYSSQYASFIVCNSTDGITWTQVFSSSTRYLQLVYGKDKFIASDVISVNGNYQGVMMTSSDGISWTVQNNSTIRDYGPFFITYGSGKFVAHARGNGGGAKLLYSTDGINWTTSTQFSNWIAGITFGNGLFIAQGGSNQQYSSIDGVTWTTTVISNSNETASLRFLNGKFFMLSGTRFYYSGPFTAVNPTSSAVLSFAEGGIFQVPNAPTITRITTSGGNGSIAFTPPVSDGGQPITNYEYSVDNGNTWVTPSPEVTTSPLAMPGDTVGDILIRAVNRGGVGCPSTTYTLLPCYTTTSSSSASKCPAELPYLWNGISCNAAGDFTWTGVNAGGCDSIATLTLTITNQSVTYDTVSVCASYTWPANNVTYTQSGDYSYVNSCLTNYLNLSVTTPPPTPSGLACYETATLNTTSCQWEVTGTQPSQPSVACYETATWNGNTCQWEISGTQPTAPTGLACYETASFNNSTCQWEITGTPVVASVSVTDSIACFGETGSLLISVSGGTAPYVGDGVVVAGPGTWSYTVSDANGCTAVSNSVTLVEPSKLQATVSTIGSTCGLGNGSAIVIPTGGTSPYTYFWSNGGTDDTLSSVIAGNYSATVTDANGCTGSASGTVSNTGAPVTAATGSISGASGACRNSSVTYSVAPVANATSYAWTLPSGSTGSSTTTSITVNFGNNYNGGFVCVRPSNSCNTGTQSCINVPVFTAAPAQPGTINISATPCGPRTITCSVTPVAQAISYTWSVAGTSATIVSGQGTNAVQISIPTGFTNAQLSVSASNCRGTSSSRYTTLVGLPSITGPLTGPVYLCPNQIGNFTIPTPFGATSAQWTVTGNAQVTSSSLTGCSVKALSNWTGGVLTVSASNACGSSTKSFTLNAGPLQPGGITGPAFNVCYASGTRTATYSIASVAGAASYSWTVPTGMTITSNTGTSITVSVGSNFTFGNVCVSAVNACGTGQPRCLAVTNRTSIPTVVTGPTSVCKSQNNVTYMIAPVTGATSYAWSISGGALLTPSATVATANFTTATSANVVISVAAYNACGNSNPAKYTIGINMSCRTAQSTMETKTRLFPNPTHGNFTVEFVAETDAAYRFELRDILGQKVAEQTVNAAAGANQLKWELNSLNAGIYLMQVIRPDGQSETVRVIVD